MTVNRNFINSAILINRNVKMKRYINKGRVTNQTKDRTYFWNLNNSVSLNSNEKCRKINKTLLNVKYGYRYSYVSQYHL